MTFVFLASILSGLFAKGWVGKLVIFPIGISCWQTVSSIREGPKVGLAGHLTAFSVMLMLSVLISGTVGVITEAVKPHLFGEATAGRWSAQEESGIQHFRRALDLEQEETRLVNNRVRQEGYMIGLGPSELRRYRDLLSEAIDEARAVDDATLAKIHDELPNAFRSYFQRSVELQLAQYEKALSEGIVNVDAQLEAQRVGATWSDWYSEHLQELRAGLK